MSSHRAIYLGGFGETCESDAARRFSELGVSCHQIDWEQSIAQNARALSAKTADSKSVLVVAFSLGCLVALEYARLARERIGGLILCSVSPFFAGYSGVEAGEVSRIVGKNLSREIAAFDAESCLTPDIYCSFFVGEDEDAITKERTLLLSSTQTPARTVFQVPSCGHNIGDVRYLDAVCGAIEKLAPNLARARLH